MITHDIEVAPVNEKEYLEAFLAGMYYPADRPFALRDRVKIIYRLPSGAYRAFYGAVVGRVFHGKGEQPHRVKLQALVGERRTISRLIETL